MMYLDVLEHVILAATGYLTLQSLELELANIGLVHRVLSNFMNFHGRFVRKP